MDTLISLETYLRFTAQLSSRMAKRGYVVTFAVNEHPTNISLTITARKGWAGSVAQKGYEFTAASLHQLLRDNTIDRAVRFVENEMFPNVFST